MHLSLFGKYGNSSVVAYRTFVLDLFVDGFFISFEGGNVDHLAVTESVHDEVNIHLFEFFFLIDGFLTVLDDSSSLS